MPALLLLVAALPALLFAAGNDEDFPLNVHVVRQEMATHGMFGGGVGTIHPYTLFIVHIDGDPRELALECLEYKCYSLLGNYKGRWNKNRTLEIQFLNDQGKLKHERFRIQTENPLPPEPPAEGKQPASALQFAPLSYHFHLPLSARRSPVNIFLGERTCGAPNCGPGLIYT